MNLVNQLKLNHKLETSAGGTKDAVQGCGESEKVYKAICKMTDVIKNGS